MSDLSITVTPASAAAVEAEIASLLQFTESLPKKVAKRFFSELLRLLDSKGLHISVTPLGLTTLADNQVVGLGVGGYGELVAAARVAVKC